MEIGADGIGELRHMPHRRQDPPKKARAGKGSGRPSALAVANTTRKPTGAVAREDGGVRVVRAAKKAPPGGEKSVFIGSRIREMRKAQSLTLQQLADRSDLSPAHLSQLERNHARPSITALASIAQGLKVNLHWFFASESSVLEDHEINYVVRKHERRRLVYRDDVIDELLSPNLARRIEFLYCVMPPKTGTGDDAYSHDGEEAGFILSGTFELWVGERHFLLTEGDSFAYSSDELHRYYNPGPGTTIVLWVITPPNY
jgi:transcriptional regulator with XRE-family HTH domain